MKETRFKDTEIGRIPEDWSTDKLGDIGELAMCRRIFQDETSPNGDIPFYKIGTFGKKADAFISKEKFEAYKSTYRYPQKGDILISAAGTIGRLVVFDGTPSYFQDSNIVWLAHNNRKVINPFLHYRFQTIKWNIENTTIARLYNNNFNNTLISFPPLSEQSRIASALTSIDNLISSLDKLIEKKKAIKEGTMQQLLTGKKRLKGFNEPWVERKLGEIASMNSGGTPTSSNPSYYDGNINFLSISDMTASGKYIKATEKTITELGLSISSARLFPAGTLMYAMYASLGKCSISTIDTAISQAILGFKLSDQVERDFLYYHFSFIENKVKTMGQTGTQSNLSKGIVKEFSINLPSLSEQRAIACVLSSMDNEISAIQAKKAKYESIKQGMMQQLLTGRIRLV